jgi:C_GCAxxG_C_C family probable redox protein
LKAKDVVKAATGFAGGVGRYGSLCGGYTGGVMAFGLLYGRDIDTMKYADPAERLSRLHQIEDRMDNLIKELAEKFKAEYGSTICNDIETKLFGRSFDKWNPAEREEKGKLGGYKEKCPGVVGNAARWIAELILEEKGKEKR